MEIQLIKQRRASSRWVAAGAAAILFASGCNRMGDTTENFTSAIDKYYNTHPSCLFTEPMNFPLQADDSNSKQASGFDALVHQALLARGSAEARVMVAAGQQENTYNLTAKGHAAWTADAQQAGFGNFCYGHRTVTAIDSSTPTTSRNGATTDVVYRYVINGAPQWAQAAEVQTDFPNLQGDLAGTQVGRATLTNTRKGWQVSSAPWAHISDSDIYK